jgi:phage/plasmid-associated DNA primase
MSRQILFCVESNNKARTDYQYIEETLKRFYKVDRKIRYRAIYLGSKTKYNAKDKVREINKNIKTFIGETTVIYFIDVDDYDTSYDTKKLYDDIEIYCKKHGYEFVFFIRMSRMFIWGIQLKIRKK